MSDLTYLINYLAKENKTDSNGPIKKYVQFDDNFILNNFFLQAEGNQIFSAVYDTYLITVSWQTIKVYGTKKVLVILYFM